MLNSILAYISSAFVSVLPHRYRLWYPLSDSLEFVRGNVLSGIVESGLAAAALTFRYRSYSNTIVASSAAGQRGFADFALQPLNLFLLFLLVEGIVRTVAPAIWQKTLGLLPLTLVSWAHSGIESLQRRSMKRGQPIVDEILRGDGENCDIIIQSCRPKADWKYMTIRFRDEFYVLASEAKGSDPRPFVYKLRKNPTGRLVVNIHDYHPAEGVNAR